MADNPLLSYSSADSNKASTTWKTMASRAIMSVMRDKIAKRRHGAYADTALYDEVHAEAIAAIDAEMDAPLPKGKIGLTIDPAIMSVT